MGQITSIKTQAKRQDRVSIYVDKKYVFSLSLWQLGSMGLKVGQEIDETRIQELKNTSEFGKLYDRVINWMMIRPRSKWELQDYLRRKTDDEAVRDEIVKRLEERKYINDEDFASAWVRNRRLLKPMSTYKLKQELIKKRVPAEIIDKTLAEDDTNDLDTVKTLIEKKRRLTRYQDKQKLMAYLLRQGFRYDVIKQGMEELKIN